MKRDVWEVHCVPTDFNDVSEAFKAAGLEPESAEITRLPSTVVDITDAAEASKVLKLMEALDEAEDVQAVYANFDIDDKIMASLEE